jgi:diketogulonate reductase-like aldo/keto reductase
VPIIDVCLYLYSELPDLLENTVVQGIAKAHNVTPEQVLLRHLTQEGLVVIPESTNLVDDHIDSHVREDSARVILRWM